MSGREFRFNGHRDYDENVAHRVMLALRGRARLMDTPASGIHPRGAADRT